MKQTDLACSIGTLLTRAGSPTADLLKQAERVGMYRHALREWAITHSCTGVRDINIRRDTLTVHVDNAAAGTILRYRANELLLFLRRRCGSECTRVAVKIGRRAPDHG